MGFVARPPKRRRPRRRRLESCFKIEISLILKPFR